MGIKRCPYCRALVEEGALYCRNCGTQLLFPEDESIEEDIPGDKIGLESEEEVEEEIILEEEQEEEIEEESFKGEELEQLSEEERMEGEKRLIRRRKVKDKSGEEMEIEEELTGHEEEAETLLEEETEEVETPQEATEPTFDFPTAELERLTRSVDEGQKKVEDFLEFLKEKAGDRQPDETFAALKKETKKPELIPGEESELPPWAEAIRDKVETEVSPSTGAFVETPQGYSFEAEEESSFQETEETISTSDDWERAKSGQPWQTDSGVGLPERPGQQPLPFESELKMKKRSWKGEEEEPEMMEETKSSLRAERMKSQIREEEKGEAKEEGFEQEEAEQLREEKSRSRPFLNWLKAKIFDLLFVGLLWFIAFVLAARIVAQPFLALIGASAYQAGAFFLLLFGGYLFLFRFFIGETLGDRLFSPGD